MALLGFLSRALVVLLATVTLAVASQLPPNVIELDLISPREDGQYAAPANSLPVVLSLQNPNVAYYYGWRFSFVVWSVEADDNTASSFYTRGSLGASVRNDTMFDESDSTAHLEVYDIDNIPAGEYNFSWEFRMGPWCEYLPGSAEYNHSPRVSRGLFRFAVEEDAPSPVSISACPSAIGMVGYETLTTYHGLIPSLDSPVGTTMYCAVTSPVTQDPEPCRVTLDAAQEASLSLQLQSGGTSPVPTESIASPVLLRVSPSACILGFFAVVVILIR